MTFHPRRCVFCLVSGSCSNLLAVGVWTSPLNEEASPLDFLVTSKSTALAELSAVSVSSGLSFLTVALTPADEERRPLLRPSRTSTLDEKHSLGNLVVELKRKGAVCRNCPKYEHWSRVVALFFDKVDQKVWDHPGSFLGGITGDIQRRRIFPHNVIPSPYHVHHLK